jgi:hypothetical protein
MRRFLVKHAATTTGTLSCFDRLLFKGHLPLGYPHAMEEFLSHRGILFKDLKGFVLKQAERLKVHAHAVAEKAGRPYEYFESPVRKDQRARAIAARDGITEGLVCVFGTIEPCRSFRLAYGHGRPTIRPAWRKCLFLYFYFLDREFGFCHARVQTWFPFTMQVYGNGHEWLARQMDKRGLRYRRLENAFLWLDDPGRVQRIADRFATLQWPAILDGFAHRVNPLLRDELVGYRYYWATHQAEFATDVLFTSRLALRALYVRLLRHATLCLRAEDVLTFLGRKLHGGFAGEMARAAADTQTRGVFRACKPPHVREHRHDGRGQNGLALLVLGAPSRLTPWSTANRIAAEGSPPSLLRLSARSPANETAMLLEGRLARARPGCQKGHGEHRKRVGIPHPSRTLQGTRPDQLGALEDFVLRRGSTRCPFVQYARSHQGAVPRLAPLLRQAHARRQAFPSRDGARDTPRRTSAQLPV